MTELILMPDTELVVCTWLRAALDARSEPYTNSVYVSNEVPETRRDRMVIVSRIGGNRRDVVRDTPQVRFWVWAMSKKDANDLTNMVRGLLPQMANGKPVLFVEETSGPVPVVDRAVPQEQRLMTYSIYLRGIAAN